MGMRMYTDPGRNESFNSLPPGKYHFELVKVAEIDVESDKPSTRFDLVCHASSVQGTVGRTHQERIWWYGSENAQKINQKQISTFAHESGAATFDEQKAMAEESGELQIDWSRGLNKHLACEIYAWGGGKEEEVDGKKTGKKSEPRICIKPGCIWAIPADGKLPQDLADFPVNMDAMQGAAAGVVF